MCASYDVPLAAAALQFATLHPVVSSVLVGARTAEEVAANVALYEHDIPTSVWVELDDLGIVRRPHLTEGSR